MLPNETIFLELYEMATTKIEFAVQMTCDSCAEAVKECFQNVSGVRNVDIDVKTGSVVVDTNLSTVEVQKILEKSGRKAVVKGYAGQQTAVAILEIGVPEIRGVVRFVQLPHLCIIDGTVDGLMPGPHLLRIHECGDMSQGCKSVGDCYQPLDFSKSERMYGDLGQVNAEVSGRSVFRFEDNVIKVPDLIGRSLVLSDSSNRRLVCGIIARSSGLFENPKMICACDGVSIWDERNVPKSGL